MNSNYAPIIIIGSGPAGYTAGIYAARAMLQPLLIAGLQPGGQLMTTTDIENYPGFSDPIHAPFLVEEMHKQAKRVGVKIEQDYITHADLSVHPFSLKGDSSIEYTCQALIIASGAQVKWLSVPGEKEFTGYGVSSCATCDGFFFRKKDVVVVGGGNSAFEEAIYLSGIAKTVFLIHRRSSFRAEKLLQERLFAKQNIHVIKDTVLDEIFGVQGDRPFVSSVRLKNILTHSFSEISVQGVFIAIGHLPASQLFERQLKLKPSGHIWTSPGSSKTSVSGVFAAGDVTDDVYRQAITAAGQGCMAALDAEKYLLHHQDDMVDENLICAVDSLG